MLRISHKIGQFLSYLAVGNPLWSNTAPWKPSFSPILQGRFSGISSFTSLRKNELFKFHCCFIIFLARTQVGHVTCCYCILYLLNDAICWQKANQIGAKQAPSSALFPWRPPFSWSSRDAWAQNGTCLCSFAATLATDLGPQVWHGVTPQCLTWKWTFNQTNILSMEELLHQLVGSLSRYLQGFIAPRWSCSFFPWFMITTQTCPVCVFVIEFKFPFPNQTGTSKQTNKQTKKQRKKQTNKETNNQTNKGMNRFFPAQIDQLFHSILRPKNRPSGGGPRATSDEWGGTGWKQSLVGGFNPSEKYWSKWESSPSRGENKKYLKPPVRRSPWRNTPLNTWLLLISMLYRTTTL